MVVRVQKWGNSLALRIPKAFALETGLAEGGAAELTVAEGALVVKPTAPDRPALKQLVAGITRSNRHLEADFGGGTGGEAW